MNRDSLLCIDSTLGRFSKKQGVEDIQEVIIAAGYCIGNGEKYGRFWDNKTEAED